MSSERNASRHPPDVNPIEPLSSLRAHPEWHFHSGEFERETIISLLVREALFSPVVTQAEVRTDGFWTSVTADGDWLGGDLRSFATPTPFPEGGVNAMRSEVLLTAFCDSVATAAHGPVDYIDSARSQQMPISMVRCLDQPGEGRVIVFHSPHHELTATGVISPSSNIFSKERLDQSIERLDQYAHA